jgi:hypothetical protein
MTNSSPASLPHPIYHKKEAQPGFFFPQSKTHLCLANEGLIGAGGGELVGWGGGGVVPQETVFQTTNV